MTHHSTYPAILRASVAMPRSVIIRPQANAAVIAELTTALEEFKTRNDKKLDAKADLKDLQAAIDHMAAMSASGQIGSVTGGPVADADYTKAFNSYARGSADGRDKLLEANKMGDRQQINAAMTAAPGEQGGYLAPVEWDRSISKALTPRSPMRRLADVRVTTSRGYTTVWGDDAWGSGWVGETAARPATATPVLKPIEFTHGEIYANPGITQGLLDDAGFDLEKWLSTEVEEKFNAQEGVAFIAGDGVNKPRGLLTYVPGGASETAHPGGTLAIVPSGNATNLTNSDNLVDFVYGHPAPYRVGAAWLMNSATAANIAKMKDLQGHYLWRETYVAGQPATLLGYRVEIDENMPNIAAGTLPIAFGDFQRGYVINDRMGIRILRDPYSNKPFVHFYTTKRVGGGVKDPRAIRLLKIAAS